MDNLTNNSDKLKIARRIGLVVIARYLSFINLFRVPNSNTKFD